MDAEFVSVYKRNKPVTQEGMFSITWAVVFQKDGLGIREMIDYFDRHTDTTVLEVFEVDAHDLELGITYWYILNTDNTIMVPLDIMLDLNLKRTDPHKYIYMPIARES